MLDPLRTPAGVVAGPPKEFTLHDTHRSGEQVSELHEANIDAKERGAMEFGSNIDGYGGQDAAKDRAENRQQADVDTSVTTRATQRGLSLTKNLTFAIFYLALLFC